MKDYFKKLKYLFSWKDLLFTVVLFGIILTIALLRADTLVETTFQEDSVDIVSSRYCMNIPYDMIDEAELTARIDSEILSGKGDIALQTGTWVNDVWGEFEACLDLDTDNCVVVHLNDGRIFVFSQSDDATTESLYLELLTHLE